MVNGLILGLRRNLLGHVGDIAPVQMFGISWLAFGACTDLTHRGFDYRSSLQPPLVVKRQGKPSGVPNPRIYRTVPQPRNPSTSSMSAINHSHPRNLPSNSSSRLRHANIPRHHWLRAFDFLLPFVRIQICFCFRLLVLPDQVCHNRSCLVKFM